MIMANETLALDLDLFDPAKSGYVPAEEPQKKIIKEPKIVRSGSISRKEAAQQEKQSRSAALKACSFALFALLIIGSLIYFRVILTNLNVELNAAKTEYAASQSEYTTLQMKFNSLLAPDKVEAYARDELDMVKLENYQIRYFDLSGSDGAQLTQ